MTNPRGSAQLIYSHHTELLKHLPAPSYRWKWSDTELSLSLLQRMSTRGLITQTRDGEAWRTTRKMWDYLHTHYGDMVDAADGAVGQKLLV